MNFLEVITYLLLFWLLAFAIIYFLTQIKLWRLRKNYDEEKDISRRTQAGGSFSRGFKSVQRSSEQSVTSRGNGLPNSLEVIKDDPANGRKIGTRERKKQLAKRF